MPVRLGRLATPAASLALLFALAGCSGQPSAVAPDPTTAQTEDTAAPASVCPDGIADAMPEIWVAGSSDKTADMYTATVEESADGLEDVPAGLFDDLGETCVVSTYSTRTQSTQTNIFAPGMDETAAGALEAKITEAGWVKSGAADSAARSYVQTDGDGTGFIVMVLPEGSGAPFGFADDGPILVVQVGESTDWGAF